MPEGQWPRGATPHLRSGGAAERRYPASKVRSGGREELPHAPMPKAKGGGREKQPHPRPGAVAGRTNPRSKEPWLCRHRRA